MTGIKDTRLAIEQFRQADPLKGHVRQNLANYKVPRDILIVRELPRSNTGKVSRKELRALASGAKADTVGTDTGS